MDISGIHGRIAYWRQRRGMTQDDFAARLGRSRSWVQKLEAGDRQSDPRISVLELIAETLTVPLETLLGVERDNDKECVDATEISEIRATLMRPDVITGFVANKMKSDSKLVRRNVSYGFDAYQSAHYSTLGRILPNLIVDAQRATSLEDLDTFATLSDVYHLTTLVLMKFSAADLAWHAADRALTTAYTSGNPVSIGLAAQALTYAMSSRGEERAGVDVSTTTAAAIRDELVSLGPPGWTVYGMLFLKAAVAAASASDGDAARNLLKEARDAAAHIGDRNDFHTGFGITNCLLHEASILSQLGEHGASLAAARLINPASFASLPRERRTHHLIDTAVSYYRSRQVDNALISLLEAERLGAQEVHCRPASRQIIGEMLHFAAGSSSSRLRALAERSGVAI